MPLERFISMFPLSCALGLEPVPAGDLGFDELDVQAKLGPDRFAKLMSGVTHVFCCGHAKYPAGHTKPGVLHPADHPTLANQPVDLEDYEVHCIYANDIESFLKAGG